MQYTKKQTRNFKFYTNFTRFDHIFDTLHDFTTIHTTIKFDLRHFKAVLSASNCKMVQLYHQRILSGLNALKIDFFRFFKFFRFFLFFKNGLFVPHRGGGRSPPSPVTGGGGAGRGGRFNCKRPTTTTTTTQDTGTAPQGQHPQRDTGRARQQNAKRKITVNTIII